MSTSAGSSDSDAPQQSAGRLRILQVSGSAAGGVRTHLADCARILAADGHDVIVEAPAAVLDGLDVAPARAEALEIGARPSLGDSRVVARLRRLGRRAHTVHAHGLRAGALAALALGRRRRGRTRLVVTLHNLTVGGRLTTLVGERLERLIASRADLVLAVSPDLAERARGLGTARVELAVIPAPVPHPSSEPTSSGSTAPEDVWPQEGARILTVARLAPQKGLSLLLDAAYDYFRATGRRVSIEYALIKDMNDHAWRAQRLADELCSRGRGWAHVNPIPLNPTPGSIWTCSEPDVQDLFVDTLRRAGITTTVRDTRGSDIEGACGQLATEVLHQERART